MIDFQYCEMRPEVEIMWRHSAEISWPIDNTLLVSYWYYIHIDSLTLAVHELLSIFIVLKSDRKWKWPYVAPPTGIDKRIDRSLWVSY
jgi:hypothetical protein